MYKKLENITCKKASVKLLEKLLLVLNMLKILFLIAVL